MLAEAFLIPINPSTLSKPTPESISVVSLAIKLPIITETHRIIAAVSIAGSVPIMVLSTSVAGPDIAGISSLSSAWIATGINTSAYTRLLAIDDREKPFNPILPTT